MQRVAILGSTGSIGINALDVARVSCLDFKAVGLSTNSNIDTLCAQIEEFKPLFVCVKEPIKAEELRHRLSLKHKRDKQLQIFSGEEGLLKMLEDKRIDKIVLAISGSAALSPLLKAIEAGVDVALANKEALVMAGPIIMEMARKKNVKIIPIDSEQSAIWQCLEGQDRTKLKNIYLTASGGPFRKLSKKKFKNISVKRSLKHPRWKMGEKITIDSATLMNKGLEVLEAVYLFGITPERVKIVIHPESVIHSMVELIDGVVLAQLSVADMRIPIQYALSYPERLPSAGAGIDFCKLRQLNFEKPDFDKFPCLGLAYRAASEKGTSPCVLNAANEVSVGEFLKGKLDFISIPKIIKRVLDRHNNKVNPDLCAILEADKWARKEAHTIIERIK